MGSGICHALISRWSITCKVVDRTIGISTRGGEIIILDYEDKIKEAINQATIHIEEEKVE